MYICTEDYVHVFVYLHPLFGSLEEAKLNRLVAPYCSYCTMKFCFKLVALAFFALHNPTWFFSFILVGGDEHGTLDRGYRSIWRN